LPTSLYMWALAIKTLVADRGKLVAALVGVVFSVVLVNVQGGLFLGLMRKASLLVDQGHADIWVGHKDMNNVDFPQDVPRRFVQRIRSIEGVARAEPYLVGHSVMTLPSGGFEYVLVVGCDAATLLGAVTPTPGTAPDAIRQPDGILVDTCDAHKIGNPQLGDMREIGRRRAKIVGFTHGVLGFLVTPYVFTTIERAAGYLNRGSDDASYFLVQIQDGADPATICHRIQERVPDLEAYTRDQYATASVGYWLKRTGLGISFGAATFLGLIVGLIIVAQTLYASVLDRLADFGALKAIGAQDKQVRTLIFRQALSLAAIGSIIGLACVMVIQQLFSTPNAPIAIPWYLSFGSCLVVIAVCLVASMLPYWRVRSIDPAMVLQG
jgi:putative ABC transport system permease protein